MWLELFSPSLRYPKIGYSSCAWVWVSRAGPMDEATVPTMDSLRRLGFQPDPTVVSDGCPGLSFDFGNLTLQASSCLNLGCVEIVLFGGVLSTPRSLAEVHFEMPRRVKSLKQCAAWIVWNLDQHSDNSIFNPARYVRWVGEGRENKKLLPWVKSMAEYRARPQCKVQRDWLRLALKTLGEYLAYLPDNAAIVFSFDGSLLSIRFDKKVIALPGEGPPWTVSFEVEARALRCLPKRLRSESISVSIWESRLALGNWICPGTLEEFGSPAPSRVQ